MKPNPQPRIGTYRLGMTNVDVFGLIGQRGGQFYCAPDDTSLPRVKVGFDYNHWWDVLNVLLHESFEFLAAQKGVRFVPCGASVLHASDIYQFQFDHNCMTQILDDQAYFLAKCVPDVCAAWNKHRKMLDKRNSRKQAV